VAQSIPPAFADTEVALTRLGNTPLTHFPHNLGQCKVSATIGNDRSMRLEPVSVGKTNFYQMTERCDADSQPVSQVDSEAKALLRLTPTTAFWFLFTDSHSGPGSPEWQVLLSFRPVRSGQQ
jgi:hypothetical protein